VKRKPVDISVYGLFTREKAADKSRRKKYRLQKAGKRL